MLKNSQYLASDTDVLHVANMMTRFGWGDGTNECEKDIQCDLLEEDAGHCVDPSRLPYKERLRWHFKQFCYKTSSHGIPMLGQAPNLLYRAIWIFLLLMCAGTFIYQACSVVEKYQRMDKITDIQLKFDTAPFPAITICNLNPYKDSLLQNVQTIKKILNVFNDVMEKAGQNNMNREREEPPEAKDEEAEKGGEAKRRRKRAAAMFEPAYSDCECAEEDGVVECTANTTNKPSTEKMCLCAFDRDSGDAWPCYPRDTWNEEMCDFCDDHNYCTKQATSITSVKSSERKPCLCQKFDPFCVAFDSTIDILKLWEYYGNIKIDDAKVLEALGFKDMNDEVAIVTKAKENIIFAMSKLSRNQRIALSIQKHQLLHKCSFNGIACDIDRDFLIIDDPTFGNCFMFNHNRTEIKSSLRAGPMYGLRILVYVNATEYLPTTEAVGIRITIHDKDDYPFPDTFGYSAPTGYISSFGMRMSRMSRLPAPYGDCVPNGLTTNYIYEGFRYSTEGCYRTCFQDLVVKDCGCGDPRFPVLKGAQHCEVFNPDSRKCLERRTNDLSNVHGSFRCRCQQPCDQSVYTVSYSAAKWPSQSLNISLGNCNLSPEECNEHYQENGAMIEVFYEALNFEVFSESEAYGVVKMLADFGGQLGLWSGVSFLTCCEFVFLFLETIYMVFHHHYIQYKKKKQEEEDALNNY